MVDGRFECVTQDAKVCVKGYGSPATRLKVPISIKVYLTYKRNKINTFLVTHSRIQPIGTHLETFFI